MNPKKSVKPITWGDTPLVSSATGLEEGGDSLVEDKLEEEMADKIADEIDDPGDLTKPSSVIRDSLARTHGGVGDMLSYYPVEVKHPLDPNREPYTVDAIDIIEALGMSYSEGSLFKALWRKCAVRQGVYRREQSDAQKMLFFSHRVLGDDVTPKGKKA